MGEKGAWAYPGTAKIFGVPPIISGKGKAMNFKFCRNIHSVHPSKSPLEIWEKRERGRIRGLPKFLEYPLLSQERVKLQTANLAGIFTGSIRAKPLKNWEKRERGRIQGLPKFFEYPLLSQERVKLRTSNLAGVFRVSTRTKAP